MPRLGSLGPVGYCKVGLHCTVSSRCQLVVVECGGHSARRAGTPVLLGSLCACVEFVPLGLPATSWLGNKGIWGLHPVALYVGSRVSRLPLC